MWWNPKIAHVCCPIRTFISQNVHTIQSENIRHGGVLRWTPFKCAATLKMFGWSCTSLVEWLFFGRSAKAHFTSVFYFGHTRATNRRRVGFSLSTNSLAKCFNSLKFPSAPASHSIRPITRLRGFPGRFFPLYHAFNYYTVQLFWMFMCMSRHLPRTESVDERFSPIIPKYFSIHFPLYVAYPLHPSSTALLTLSFQFYS